MRDRRAPNLHNSVFQPQANNNQEYVNSQPEVGTLLCVRPISFAYGSAPGSEPAGQKQDPDDKENPAQYFHVCLGSVLDSLRVGGTILLPSGKKESASWSFAAGRTL